LEFEMARKEYEPNSHPTIKRRLRLIASSLGGFAINQVHDGQVMRSLQQVYLAHGGLAHDRRSDFPTILIVYRDCIRAWVESS